MWAYACEDKNKHNKQNGSDKQERRDQEQQDK